VNIRTLIAEVRTLSPTSITAIRSIPRSANNRGIRPLQNVADHSGCVAVRLMHTICTSFIKC